MPKRTGAATAPPPARKTAGSTTGLQEDPTEYDDLDGEARAEAHGRPDEPEDEELVGLDEAQEEDNFFGVWYGIPGSTKTTSIARVLLARPEGKLVICNAEAGLKVRALRQHGVDTSRIQIWPKPGIRPTFDGMERLVLKMEAELAESRRLGQPKPYCAFAGDSITELVKLMLDNVLEAGIEGQREIDRKAKMAGVAPPRRNMRARFKTERDDYGLVSNQVRAILRKLRYLPIDVMFTALVRRDEDQDTGNTMYGPGAPPALQQDLLGYADVVIRTERRTNAAGREEIVGYTYSDQQHHGKDRYGLLPPEIMPPAADVVLGYILGDVMYSPDSAPLDDPDSAAEAEVTGESELEIEARNGAEAPAAKKPATRGRKTPAKVAPAKRGSAGHDGRIDVKVFKTVGAGDGTDDEPPF